MKHRVWLSWSMTVLPLLAPLAACSTSVEADPSAQNGAAAAPVSSAATAAHTHFKTVFTTRKRVLGELIGGFDGADAICNQSAAAARLTGTFKAWLSDLKTSAGSRLGHATVPYQLVTGVQVAADFDDLTDGSIDAPIDRDEYGQAITDAGFNFKGEVWSMTTATGDSFPWTPSTVDPAERRPPDCDSWTLTGATGLIADMHSIDVDWTETSAGIGCNQTAHLYCFEQ